MNARATGFLIASALGLVGALLAGCSILPDSASDPARLYLLVAPTPAAAPRAAAPSVQIRPIELASYLRGRPIMVRRGDNEIEFRDFALWGEPLESGVARVIREELYARGAASVVQVAGGRRDNGQLDYALTVKILACEGRADGEVLFRAVWELNKPGAKAPPIGNGDYRPGDLRWDGKTEASLVEQLSLAAGGLAGEIAGALKK
jgi:hypothetical protein